MTDCASAGLLSDSSTKSQENEKVFIKVIRTIFSFLYNDPRSVPQNLDIYESERIARNGRYSRCQKRMSLGARVLTPAKGDGVHLERVLDSSRTGKHSKLIKSRLEMLDLALEAISNFLQGDSNFFLPHAHVFMRLSRKRYDFLYFWIGALEF